jgi:hypothetical protein
MKVIIISNPSGGPFRENPLELDQSRYFSPGAHIQAKKYSTKLFVPFVFANVELLSKEGNHGHMANHVPEMFRRSFVFFEIFVVGQNLFAGRNVAQRGKRSNQPEPV